MQPIRRLRLHLEHGSIKIWMTFWHCCSHFPSGGFIPTTTLLTINEFLPNNIPQGKGTHRKSREITWLYEPVSKGSAGKPSAFLRTKRFIRPSLAPLSMCSFGAEILTLQLYCGTTNYWFTLWKGGLPKHPFLLCFHNLRVVVSFAAVNSWKSSARLPLLTSCFSFVTAVSASRKSSLKKAKNMVS